MHKFYLESLPRLPSCLVVVSLTVYVMTSNGLPEEGNIEAIKSSEKRLEMKVIKLANCGDKFNENFHRVNKIRVSDTLSLWVNWSSQMTCSEGEELTLITLPTEISRSYLEDQKRTLINDEEEYDPSLETTGAATSTSLHENEGFSNEDREETEIPTFQFLTSKNPIGDVNDDSYSTLATDPQFIDYTTETVPITGKYVKIKKAPKNKKRIDKPELFHNGYLSYKQEYYHPDEYCVKRVLKEAVTIGICPSKCNLMEAPCIPLCCRMGEVIDWNARKCKKSGEKFYEPTLYKDPFNKLSSTKVRPHYKKAKLNCKAVSNGSKFEIWSFRDIPGRYGWKKTPLRVLADGNVWYVGPKRTWLPITEITSDYCLAGLQSFGSDPKIYTGDEFDQIVTVCSTLSSEERESPKYYLAGYIIASFFLFLTAIVYLTIFEKQNVHGLTVLSFVVCMLMMFLSLSIVCIISIIDSDQYSGTWYCIGFGVMTHFFFLSTFCWLTLVNFDLWWTFRQLAPTAERSRGLKRYCLYVIFACGIPITVILIGVILTNVYPERESLVMIPEYGKITCFLAPAARGVYLYYIIGALLFQNCIFIALTLHNLFILRKGTNTIEHNFRSKKPIQSFELFGKLFVLMGVTWVFEIISWWHSGSQFNWFWVIFDIINVSQALGIFIICVCKKQIISQLEKKFPMIRTLTNRISNKPSVSSSVLTEAQIKLGVRNNAKTTPTGAATTAVL